MRAAVALRNVVGEAKHALVVAVVPPQGCFDGDAIRLMLDEDGFGNQRRLGAVEIAHEGFKPAFVHHFLALMLGMPRVGQQDAHTGIEKGQFAQAVLKCLVIELHHG